MSGSVGEVVVNRAIILRGYRRRRVCVECGRGFVTLEQYVKEVS